jgi:hypothetical protein
MKLATKTLLLAALVLPLLAPPTAQGARKMEAAIQDDGIFIFDESFDRERALRAARDLGITHIRMNILWWQAIPESQRTQTTAPSPITYNFARWDEAIARAAAYGIKTQLDLAGDPPAWACGSKKVPYECDGFLPSISRWKHFVTAVAQHFAGRVSRYSLWNEPNWYTWLSPHDDAPLLYRKLVQTGYKAIKSVNPSAQVVAGELAPHFQPNISTPPLQFIREMVCVNKKLKRIPGARRKCKGKLQFDAFSTHPYDFEHKPKFKRENPDELTIANLDALPELLGELRKKGLIKTPKKKFPIYLTEYGYMVADNPAVRPRRQIPESRRQRWIVKAWDIAQKTPRIKQQIHYTLVSPPAGSPGGYFDMGLLTSSGAPRASYFALQNWIHQAVADGRVARQGPCSAC